MRVWTVKELALAITLQKQGFVCNDLTTSTLSWQELAEKNRTVDYYISSVNAITSNGLLVSLDGYGNRVSMQYFGPKKFFYILEKIKFTQI